MPPMSKLADQLRAKVAAQREMNDSGAASAPLIPLSKISEDPDQPRRQFDQAKMDELIASVKRRGVLQPIIVRPENEAGIHIIKFGARRYRAAAAAGLTAIRAIVRAVTEDDDVDQMIENIQRADLTSEEWALYIEKKRAQGKTDTQIADEVGVSKHKIALYAAVLKLPPALRPLSSVLGPRELYELHALWRDAPDIVQGLLETHPAEDLTRTLIVAARQQLAADHTGPGLDQAGAIVAPSAEAEASQAAPAPVPAEEEPPAPAPVAAPIAAEPQVLVDLAAHFETRQSPDLDRAGPDPDQAAPTADAAASHAASAPAPVEEAPPAPAPIAAPVAAQQLAPAATRRASLLSVLVSHQGRRGELHLTRAPSTPWLAVVTFDGEDIEVRVDELALIEVRG